MEDLFPMKTIVIFNIIETRSCCQGKKIIKMMGAVFYREFFKMTKVGNSHDFVVKTNKGEKTLSAVEALEAFLNWLMDVDDTLEIYLMAQNGFNHDVLVLLQSFDFYGVDMDDIIAGFFDSNDVCQKVNKNRGLSVSLDALIERWLPGNPGRSKTDRDALKDAIYLRDVIFAMTEEEDEERDMWNLMARRSRHWIFLVWFKGNQRCVQCMTSKADGQKFIHAKSKS